MPECRPSGIQSVRGTGLKKLTMPEQVRYRTKLIQSGIFLVRYQTKIRDAGMPMPALVFWMPMPSYAYWHCESKPLCLSAGRVRPTLPLSAGGTAQPNDISCRFYICPIHWRYFACTASLLFQTSPINWVVLTGNGNTENMRIRPTKMKLTSATAPGPYPSINTTFDPP